MKVTVNLKGDRMLKDLCNCSSAHKKNTPPVGCLFIASIHWNVGNQTSVKYFLFEHIYKYIIVNL
jgi:hypothetical protein